MNSLRASDDGTPQAGIAIVLKKVTIFYPASLLYQICPAASSFGDETLYKLIEGMPMRMG